MRRRFPRASSRLRKKRCARLLRPHAAIARVPRRKQCQIRCRGRASKRSTLEIRICLHGIANRVRSFTERLGQSAHPVRDKRIRWRRGYRRSKACPRAPQSHREPRLRNDLIFSPAKKWRVRGGIERARHFTLSTTSVRSSESGALPVKRSTSESNRSAISPALRSWFAAMRSIRRSVPKNCPSGLLLSAKPSE